MKITILLIFSIFVLLNLKAQVIPIPDKSDTVDLTFKGTSINPYDQGYEKDGKLVLSGYIDVYGSHYSDTSNSNGYQKFPTISPRKDQVGINILQVSAKYQSEHFRGTATIFGGDCPESSWSNYLRFIQEANIGFKLYKKLWLDAGFFRTHFGLESIQPRENMTLSLATTTYYEPYFLSGAKLTWRQSDKLSIQLNAFNSFNQFIEINKNKAVGLSVSYNPNTKIRSTFSTIICDESMNPSLQQLRWYNNACIIYNSKKILWGLEANYGYQTNTSLPLLNKSSFLVSSLFAVKYRFNPKWGTYGRVEFYYDPNEILTGPVMNENHTIVGENLIGLTHGYEFKPIPNSYFRIESRVFKNNGERIFSYYGNPSFFRLEILAGIGFWF